MDLAADPRSLSVGLGAAVSNPRPGRCIRSFGPLDRDGDRGGRGHHGATKPVAESVCRAPDRQREARMSGPRDRLERTASETDPCFVPRLLSPIPNASFAGQGHPRGTIGPTRWRRKDLGVSTGRRAPSSVRAARGLKPLGVNRRGIGDRRGASPCYFVPKPLVSTACT